MGNVIAAVLISLPFGFMAGWVLAKTMFRLQLRAQQTAADERLKRTRQKYRTWRDRIRPIAVQFRQQRKIITELRDELRRRDLAQQEAEQQAETKQPEKAQSCSKTAPTGRESEPQRESTSRLDTVS